MRVRLLKAGIATLAHVEEKHPFPGLHANLAKQKQTAQVSALLTRKGLQRITERRHYYAVDVLLLFLASFIDRILGFAERCSFDTNERVLHKGGQ